MIGVWQAYPLRIASVLIKCIYMIPFLDLLQFFYNNAAAYMGTLSHDSGTLIMRSSYATHSLAICRLPWLYAGHS